LRGDGVSGSQHWQLTDETIYMIMNPSCSCPRQFCSRSDQQLAQSWRHQYESQPIQACILPANNISQKLYLNHIALSVPSATSAVAFYTNVLGFNLIGNTVHDLQRAESPNAAIFEMYPPSLKHVKVAMMATGNEVGFEIMEFVDPPCMFVPAQGGFEYNRAGWFHICVTHPDPDGFVEKVVAAGGKRVGRTADPIGNGVRCVYAADPWGNAIELMSVSWAEIAALAEQALPA
jgi:catechol 2,3-dioxygenase-like lactoylglutathione lyase family enzyme